MRHDDYFGAFADQRLNGRGEPFDAGCIGYLAVFDRDVQIGAQQHRLAADIDVVEGVKFRHGSTHSWLARCRLRRYLMQPYTPIARPIHSSSPRIWPHLCGFGKSSSFWLTKMRQPE